MYFVSQVSCNPKGEGRENTMMFTADNDLMDITRSHTVNIASDSVAPAKMSAISSDSQFSDFLANLSKPSDLSGNSNTSRMKPSAAQSFKKQVNTDHCLSHVSQCYDTLKSEVGKEKHLFNRSRSAGEPFEDPKSGIITAECDVSMDMTEVQTGRTISLTGSDDPFQFLLPSQDMHPLYESQKKADMTSGQQCCKDYRSSHHEGMETRNS